MNSELIFRNINMIMDMTRRDKPKTPKDQVDAFQQIFIEEVFAKTIVTQEDADFGTEESDWQYDSVIANQLMTRLLTDQLVKQDALGIRQLVLGRLKEEIDNELI